MEQTCCPVTVAESEARLTGRLLRRRAPLRRLLRLKMGINQNEVTHCCAWHFKGRFAEQKDF